jgi:hypothetical protein
MRSLKLALLILVTAGATCGQSVGPVTADCTKNCKGSFFIQNQSVVPMAFTIEPYSMHFAQNAVKPTIDTLDPGVVVKLSETSGRLSPKETRQIDYKIICAKAPCVTTLLTGFLTNRHVTEGITVRLILPHVVYQSDKGRNARKEILAAYGVTPPEDRKK